MDEQLQINILQSYIEDLHSFDLANNTLLLSENKEDSFLDISTLDIPNQATPFALIEQLITHKPNITISEQLYSEEAMHKSLWDTLNAISRQEQLIKTEKGSEELYIGYPMVRGTLADETPISTPLLLFPVSLLKKYHSTGITWKLYRRDEQISFNSALLHAYSRHNQIRIFDNLLEYNFDEFPRNTQSFHTQLAELLRVSPINISVHQSLFDGVITAFNTNIQDPNQALERLQLFPEAIIGLFPQKRNTPSPDYSFITTLFEGNQISDDAFFKPFQTQVPTKNLQQQKTILPFLVDSSQEAIIREVNAGNSLVVQGPPGTGKTQLICNLVANVTAKGKKVLVIAEKRNALDNIAHRLTTIGAENFVEIIHDFNNDRKRIYKKIAEQLDASERYQHYNTEINSTEIERTFVERTRMIEKIVTQLDDFKKALNDDSIAGISIKELYNNSSKSTPIVDLSDHFKSLKINELSDFWNALETYLDYQANIYTTTQEEAPEEDAQFWNYRPHYHNINKTEIDTIAEIIEEVHLYALQLNEDIPQVVSIKNVKAIEEETPAFKILQDNLVNERVYKTLCRNLQERIHISEEEITELEQDVKACFEGQGIEITLATQELKPFLNTLNETIVAKSKTFGGIVWGLFGTAKNTIQEITVSNGLSTSLADLLKLQERIQHRITLEEWWANWAYLFEENTLSNVSNDPNSPWLRKGYRWFERCFQELRQAIRAEKAWRTIHSISLTSWRDIPWNSFHKKIQTLRQLNETWISHKAIWQNYLSAWQLDYLIQNPTIDLIGITSFLITKFNLLQEADQLRETFTEDELAIIERSIDFSNLDKVPEIIHYSLSNAWINHIEGIYPILKIAGASQLEQLIEELQISVREKQYLSQDVLLFSLRKSCIKHLKHHSETYRELKHQVSKKRKIWSMRQLFNEFSDELFSLIPCWLTSPDTVSAIFPITTKESIPLVDLIIVDEASQADAIAVLPSLLRAKQIVVVGDSQQLPPSKKKNREDSPYSLLTWTENHLPSYHLTKHYRSKSLSLINFANAHFYEGNLQAFPHFDTTNTISINYFNVSGTYQAGINELEATMVISLLAQIRKSTPDKSIGIIVFNACQQQYLQELFDKEFAPKTNNISDIPAINIQTIDFVQGNEYDITILSLGYSSKGTHPLSIQLEDLTAAHINIACTRAKEHSYLVCSINAEDLTPLKNQHKGIDALNAYLQYIQDNYQLLDYTQSFPQLQQGESNLLVLTDSPYLREGSSIENYSYFPIELIKRGWDIHYQYSRVH